MKFMIDSRSIDDLLISFDVISFFTRVHVGDTLKLLQQIFTEDIALFRHVLTTTYFQWNNRFYEQTDGVAMGSPLNPVMTNFYTEHFEKTVLESASFKPTGWLIPLCQ